MAASTKAATVKSAWDAAVELDGADPIDKSELIGKEFLVTGVKDTVSNREFPVMWVEGEFRDGEKFVFTDASTGIRVQLKNHVFNVTGENPKPDEWTDIALLCRKGLRVSKYTAVDERGREREAQTYYLSTSGRRA